MKRKAFQAFTPIAGSILKPQFLKLSLFSTSFSETENTNSAVLISNRHYFVSVERIHLSPTPSNQNIRPQNVFTVSFPQNMTSSAGFVPEFV